MDDVHAREVAAIREIDAVPRILEVICRTTGMGFSAVARVTDSKWIACAVRDEIEFGLEPGGELVLGTTICDEIRQSGKLVVIDDVATDETYCAHHTPRKYGFKSYISVPIRLHGGEFFGTLCAIDPRPSTLRASGAVEMFQLFADLIAMHLDSQRRLVASESALLGEREASQLREQFIAVLGHDLRNPLGAINSGVELLSLTVEDEQSQEVCEMLRRSVKRMVGLIDNVLDFARGRLGSGITVERTVDHNLAHVLNHVVEELEAANPERVIRREIRIDRPFPCSSSRLGQMLSNLLGNALTHGDPESPVHVEARTSIDRFTLAVTNHGKTISPEVAAQLFQPFVRGSARPDQQGLGLGLYIATEIARAHHGTLRVQSADGGTTFTFEMPVATSGPDRVTPLSSPAPAPSAAAPFSGAAPSG